MLIFLFLMAVLGNGKRRMAEKIKMNKSQKKKNKKARQKTKKKKKIIAISLM